MVASQDNGHGLLGLPDKAAFRFLAASETAGCIVVKVRVSGEAEPSERLFIRRFDELTYREVMWPSGCNSFCDVIICRTKPQMYALGMFWENHGGNGVGLYRVTLPSGDVEFVHPSRGIRNSGLENESEWWISALLGMTSDEQALLVSLATGVPEPNGSRFEYSVCAFSLDTCEAHELARLPAVFA